MSFSFFFNDTATTEIYTLSLHDALPIFADELQPAEVRQVHIEQQQLRPRRDDQLLCLGPTVGFANHLEAGDAADAQRSEERRVGKSVDLGGRGVIEKKSGRDQAGGRGRS